MLEYRGDPVQPGRRSKFDSSQSLVLPSMPTTLVGVCRLINVYYALHVSRHEAVVSKGQFFYFYYLLFQVSLLLESEAEDLSMEFPVTIATVPFRIPNSPNQPAVYYGSCVLFNHLKFRVVLHVVVCLQNRRANTWKEAGMLVLNFNLVKFTMVDRPLLKPM